MELYHNLEEKLLQIEAFDNELGELQKQIDKLLQQLNEAADQLTQKRKNVLTFIEQELIDKLTSLGISNARILVELTPTENFLPSGKDHVDFLFAANKNATPQPIANVASGGEMSRLMLSIKSLLINTSGLPTIIFDEIDTGVSGEIDDKMGEIMLEISNNTQVIAITHLPQIAAKGTAHYKVFKQDNENYSNTHRTVETARKTIGNSRNAERKNPSQAAIDNAAELIKISNKSRKAANIKFAAFTHHIMFLHILWQHPDYENYVETRLIASLQIIFPHHVQTLRATSVRLLIYEKFLSAYSIFFMSAFSTALVPRL